MSSPTLLGTHVLLDGAGMVEAQDPLAEHHSLQLGAAGLEDRGGQPHVQSIDLNIL